MDTKRNYYEVLQVHELAEPEVIEAAYKRLAKKYHPDTNPSTDATKRMAELNEAYAILSDPYKRLDYDSSIKVKNTLEITKPFIAFSHNSLDFGSVEQGDLRTKDFQIFNSGGSASTVHIDWEKQPTWGSLEIRPNEGPDPFPITVSVSANTKLGSVGENHSAITTTVDGEVFKLPISLTITPKVAPPKPAPIPKPAPSPRPSYTPKTLTTTPWQNSIVRSLAATTIFIAVVGVLGMGWAFPPYSIVLATSLFILFTSISIKVFRPTYSDILHNAPYSIYLTIGTIITFIFLASWFSDSFYHNIGWSSVYYGSLGIFSFHLNDSNSYITSGLLLTTSIFLLATTKKRR